MGWSFGLEDMKQMWQNGRGMETTPARTQGRRQATGEGLESKTPCAALFKEALLELCSRDPPLITNARCPNLF